MLLSVQFLNDVSSVNSYERVTAAEIYAGDSQTIYVQLIDASLDRSDQSFNPPGRRYMPPAGSTVKVTFLNIDDKKTINRTASQPFPQDPSIWSIPILSSDPLAGTSAMNLSLTEPSGRKLNSKFATGSMLRIR